MMDLSLELFQILNYSVFMFALIAYAALDGFDLGVGCMHLFAKGDNERRLMINAIGPVWDSNTTWVVISSGVLFAGFPKAFAFIMQGFYTPIMLLLFCYILRGAAVEFRSKRPEKVWRTFWDIAFFTASLLAAFDVGMILGNLIEGLPIDQTGRIHATFFDLLAPYPLLVSLLGISVFVMHGSTYLLMKTEGKLRERLRGKVKWIIAAFLSIWAITTTATFMCKVHMTAPFFERPWLIIFALLSIFSILAVPHCVTRHRDGWAFIATSFSIVFLLILFVIGSFPYFLQSTLAPEYSLTLYNSSATRTALMIMTGVALTGIPLSCFYVPYLWKVFKGKIRLDTHSY